MISRLCLFTGLLFSCFFVFACKPRERPADVALRNQMLLIANGAEPQSLDPHIISGVPEMRIVMNLFEGLVGMNPETLQPEPASAERWEISDDGKTYTFHLRKNLKWSNGDPLTAKDFLYSFKRAISPKIASPYITFLQGITNAVAYNKAEVTDFEQVGCKMIDDYTLEFYLDYPLPVLLINMANGQYFYPVHQATIEAHGEMDQRGTPWFRPENMVCNGAFQLKEWTTNTLLSIEPNPNYWDHQVVRLKQANFYPIENQDTQYRSFVNGEVHVANQIPLQVIQELEQTRPPEYRSHLYLGTYYYGFNTRKPPLNDPRVRRALSISLDRDLIARQVAQGGQQPAYSFVPPGANNYKPDYTFKEDLAEAKRLLAEAGYPDGKGFPKLEVLFNTAENHRAIAETAQQMWKTGLGVDIGLVNMEWKVYLDARDNADFDIVRAGWVGGVDYQGYLDLFYGDSGNNDTGWTDPQFDVLYKQGAEIMNPELRMKTIQQAEEILLKAMPIIPIYHYTSNYLVDTRVKNWYSNNIDERTLKHVYLEE
jgi:oligopeptide transport system substrate-binding protein